MELEYIYKPRKIKLEKHNSSALEISYENYMKKNINLKKYKLFDIKNECKKNKLKITGTKKLLLARLEQHYIQIKNIIKLQALCRMRICQNMIKFRGPALYNKKMCVNDTDFVSLENIDEIPNEYFYSYTDEQNFTYGFNIISLIQLISINKKLVNPYNRKNVNSSQIKKIIRLFHITMMLDDVFHKQNAEYYTIYIKSYLFINQQNIQTNNSIRQIITIMNRPVQNSSYRDYKPIITLNNISFEQNERLIYLRNIRQMTLNHRIENVFMYIDSLGNYTNSIWFHNLSISQYLLLYQYIYQIWNFRGQISNELKNNISPFYNPFTGLFNETYRYNNVYEIHYAKLICIIVFENILFSSINEEFHKIGALHILSALTKVSLPARETYFYLYESLDI
jgi:hypothetical protein